MIEVLLIQDLSQKKAAFQIREDVFVIEQKVPKELEYDEFEDSSRHFLAYSEQTPCGTARWRITDKGIKLERFAVSEAYRKQNVGSALVKAVLEDILIHPEYSGQKVYLHAQITALPLYHKFDFKIEGKEFIEANIRHHKMVWHGK